VKQDGAVAQNKVRWTRKAADWLRKVVQGEGEMAQGEVGTIEKKPCVGAERVDHATLTRG